MYHYVRDTEKTAYPEIRALSVKDFETQLDLLQQEATIVGFKEFMDQMREPRPTEKPLCLLTFDDGLIDHYENVLPIFRERGISGVFFLCGDAVAQPSQLLQVHAIHFLLAKLGAEVFAKAVQDWLQIHEIQLTSSAPQQGTYRYDQSGAADIKRLLNYDLPYDTVEDLLQELFQKHIGDSMEFAKDLYLTPSMIQEMVEAGMTFGGHTQSHRIPARLSEEDQRKQVEGGMGLIRSLTGQEDVPFCYPYGHSQTYTAFTKALLSEVGYCCAFSTTRAHVQFESAEAFALPRFDTKDLPPFAAFPPHA